MVYVIDLCLLVAWLRGAMGGGGDRATAP